MDAFLQRMLPDAGFPLHLKRTYADIHSEYEDQAIALNLGYRITSSGIINGTKFRVALGKMRERKLMRCRVDRFSRCSLARSMREESSEYCMA